jgi:hypothetical protein
LHSRLEADGRPPDAPTEHVTVGGGDTRDTI